MSDALQSPDPTRSWVRLRTSVHVRAGCRVLMIYDRDYAGGCWMLPGGAVEFDETIALAAERELLEETGIRVQIRELLGFFEIWEPAAACGHARDPVAAARKTIEVILGGQYISGEPRVAAETSAISRQSQSQRLGNCQWFEADILGEIVDGRPVHPRTLKVIRGFVEGHAVPLENLLLGIIDDRRQP